MPPEVARNAQHPERLDARPRQRRAAAVDRHGRPATSRRSCSSQATRCASRSSRTTRARTASTPSPATSRSRPSASADFGAPGADHRLHAAAQPHARPRQHPQEGRVREDDLAGRPPVSLGVTSGGNFYGNTQITFTDVLGDKQISFYAQSVSQYRTTAFTYLNIETPAAVRAAGLLAGPVLLRPGHSRRSTTRRSRRSSTAISPRRCRASAAARRS